MKRSLLVMLATFPLLGGEFINLTFDQPDLSGPLEQLFPNGPYRGNTSRLLPGWSLTANGQPLASMTYSPLVTTSVRPVSLVENSPANAAGALGKYTLYLESGLGPPGPEIRLSQRGTIPADAAGLWLASGYVQAFADGKKIGEINPMTGPFIIDVSRFAGQEVNLEFLVESGWSIRFDILGFVPVPEPETWALLSVGLGILLWFGRRK